MNWYKKSQGAYGLWIDPDGGEVPVNDFQGHEKALAEYLSEDEIGSESFPMPFDSLTLGYNAIASGWCRLTFFAENFEATFSQDISHTQIRKILGEIATDRFRDYWFFVGPDDQKGNFADDRIGAMRLFRGLAGL